jgi:hypothetical protein
MRAFPLPDECDNNTVLIIEGDRADDFAVVAISGLDETRLCFRTTARFPHGSGAETSPSAPPWGETRRAGRSRDGSCSLGIMDRESFRARPMFGALNRARTHWLVSPPQRVCAVQGIGRILKPASGPQQQSNSTRSLERWTEFVLVPAARVAGCPALHCHGKCA